MAKLMQPKSEADIRKLGVAELRNSFVGFMNDYSRVVDRDVLLCPKCGDWLKTDTSFYLDKRYATERYPICKRCLLQMVEQRNGKNDPPNETKESVQKVLQMMDKVYDDGFYTDCIKGALDEVKEKNRSSPFSTYIVAIQSLPNWKGKTWADSDFGDSDSIDAVQQEQINENSRAIKNAKKRFGKNYNNEDLLFLENEYQDWIKRYVCENKSQEVLFRNLCFTQLNIDKAQRDGKDIKDLLKSLQELMSSLQIKPSQSNSNALTEAKTFGQLIQKWEDEWDGGKPIPEVDEELRDVDHVGKYIDVFFKGHLSKMMGLKNGFSHIYESFMNKYTVTKKDYNEDEDSETLFNKIFGSQDE